MAGTTLQISLAPSDYRHAEHILPHQLRQWRDQMSEVLISIDFHRSAGRFSERWQEGRGRIEALANAQPGVRVVTVDYSEPAQQAVSAMCFGGRRVPAKDFRGGPYYAYFFGLWAARHDIVLHTDSDILFGGGSKAWMNECVETLATDRSVLVCAPLPGPPSTDGRLKQLVATHSNGRRWAPRFDTMSTRLFAIDRRRFSGDFGMLVPRRPSARNWIKAWVEGNPPQDLPEHLFTQRMRSLGLERLDFLGEAPGMWSLHAPYRCEDFYRRLPEIVALVERGEVPEAQRGDHDINDSLVDWSEARERLASNRWWKRLLVR
ncbi:MAG TPA: hypothetical protein VHZ24_21750 [Pirellulales bacterium]|jgi:hypothetical protein|nr:hypothetical protein [Pirellulales bacterium]